jgi:hypothetical protein
MYSFSRPQKLDGTRIKLDGTRKNGGLTVQNHDDEVLMWKKLDGTRKNADGT